MIGPDDLGKLVEIRTTTGDLQAVGKMFAYCDSPMLAIRTPNGDCHYWRADLSKVIGEKDTAEAIVPSTVAPRLP